MGRGGAASQRLGFWRFLKIVAILCKSNLTAGDLRFYKAVIDGVAAK
jgi:hypothetical protein